MALDSFTSLFLQSPFLEERFCGEARSTTPTPGLSSSYSSSSSYSNPLRPLSHSSVSQLNSSLLGNFGAHKQKALQSRQLKPIPRTRRGDGIRPPSLRFGAPEHYFLMGTKEPAATQALRSWAFALPIIARRGTEDRLRRSSVAQSLQWPSIQSHPWWR